MRVQRVQNNNYDKNLVSNIKTTHNRTSLKESSNTNLVSPNAYYNQVSFKGGKIGNTIPELIEYMEKTIKPFLEETDPFFEKSFKLSDKIHLAVREFNPKEIKFNPLEFREVKRLRLDELYNNEQEYYYLLKKSDNFYSTKETSDYAFGLYDYFFTPAFLREPYNAFCKMKTDIEHGLQNINLENLFPELAKKRNDVYMASSNINMGMCGYTRASLMNKKFNKMLENGFINIFEYIECAKEAERGMERHKTHLPEIEQAVNEAESLYKNGLFTEEDYNLLNSIPKRGQQVISRNAKKFNDIASKTQLSENESKQLDDILKKQKELIEDLWNKIEADKKGYFEQEAKAKAEAEKFRVEYGDDLLPF